MVKMFSMASVTEPAVKV